MTMSDARMPSTRSAITTVTQNAGPWPFSVRNTRRSTSCPITRDSTSTKVFTTPWIRASVTMSPLATCATSWPSTASASARVICCSRPVETATNAESRNAPVANALGAPS